MHITKKCDSTFMDKDKGMTFGESVELCTPKTPCQAQFSTKNSIKMTHTPIKTCKNATKPNKNEL